MISTKDLSGLPNAERLKNFCKGLAALDIIMVEEEWSFIRHYTYNPAWRKGKEAFFAFSPCGVVRSEEHTSELQSQ